VRKTIIKHGIITIALLAGSAILRFPFIGHPPVIVFDEGINASFATNIIRHEKYFDVHPPLAHLLFAAVARETTMKQELSMLPRESFNQFKYKNARLITATAGILLPPIIYLFGAMLYPYLLALVAALFVLFDNALIIYSRFVLPDIILITCGMFGLLFLLLSYKTENKTANAVFIILSGVFIGLAISVKWTALAYFLIACAIIIQKTIKNNFIGAVLKKSAVRILSIATIIIIIYISVFSILFYRFEKMPNVSASNPNTGFYYPQKYLSEISRANASFPSILYTMPRHTLYMLKANAVFQNKSFASYPFEWPLNRGTMLFWKNNENGAKIVLAGNIMSWALAFFAVFAALSIIAIGIFMPKIKERFLFPDMSENILIWYLISYLPLFYLGRDLFLYNYFTAMIISYLMVPAIFPIFLRIFGMSEKTQKYFWYSIIALIAISFAAQSQITYGF